MSARFFGLHTMDGQEFTNSWIDYKDQEQENKENLNVSKRKIFFFFLMESAKVSKANLKTIVYMEVDCSCAFNCFAWSSWCLHTRALLLIPNS